jgi:hypothetical protein
VHRVRSPSSSSSSSSSASFSSQAESLPPVTASHKQRVVSDQVNWLFSATQHGVPASSPSATVPAPLALAEFESCYHRLLASAYEQEVLWLDLKRAITALSSSAHWQSMSAVCSRARRVWAERMQASGQEAERQPIIDRIAQSLTQQAPPAQLTHALQQMRREAQSLTEEKWMRAWHDILMKGGEQLDHQQLMRLLDAELSGAAATAAGSSIDSSSNSNHPQHSGAG